MDSTATVLAPPRAMATPSGTATSHDEVCVTGEPVCNEASRGAMDDAWIDSVYPGLMRTAWAMTGDPALAEDIVQETLIGAWNGWDRFDESGNRDAWVFGILMRQTRKHFRTIGRLKRRLKNYADRAKIDDTNESPSDQRLALDEWRRSVWSEVAKLPSRQAEVVTLRFLHQMSNEEISDVTGSPVGTIKSRLHHALKRLQKSVPNEAILPS
ncbi:MAG: sigma-70 family RNA polymerase sigma factor [Planctomycetota bacterium]